MQLKGCVLAVLCFHMLASLTSASRCVMRSHCGHDEDLDKDIPCKVNDEPKALSPSGRGLFSEVCPDLAATTGPDHLTCCDVEQLRALKEDLQQPIDLGMKDYPRCLRNFRNIFCQLVCSPKQSDFVKVVSSENKAQGLPYVKKAVYAVSERFAKGSYDSCKDVKVKKDRNLMSFMCGWNCDLTKWFTFMGSTAPEGGYSPYNIQFHITKDSTVKLNGTELRPMNVSLA
ncbi:NPC intracellular cholesterol transporter 1-like [Ornithodoros turicata]|uniref:NPC intracellular cholesterol transporter 1-like n=1 Tax=Ornithodoros turicata TaxID=34597 RepID=UPI00313A11B9